MYSVMNYRIELARAVTNLLPRQMIMIIITRANYDYS